MTFITNVVTTPSEPQLDVLGGLKTSNTSTILESSHIIDINDISETQVITGAGAITLDANVPALNMTLTDTGTLTRQTRMRCVYNTSNSLCVFMTGILNAGTNGVNTTSRIGYFDSDDGIYFECKGASDLFVVVRSSGTGAVVNSSIQRSLWNVDKLDGTGISGKTLDTTKIQLYFIEFSWKGMGYVRMGIIVDDKYFYCHKFLYNNILARPFISSPIQPIRYEISSTAGGTGSLKKISGAAICYGDLLISNNYRYCINFGTTFKTTNTTTRSMLALRIPVSSPKSIYTVNSIEIVLGSTTRRDTLIGIDIIKDTIATNVLPGAVWVAGPGGVEYDITSTTYTPNNAIVFNENYNLLVSSVEISGRILTNNSITSNLGGLSDILVVTGQTLTNTASTYIVVNYTRNN